MRNRPGGKNGWSLRCMAYAAIGKAFINYTNDNNVITKCESLVVNVTGSWGSPDGQLYATLPAT